MRSIGARVEVEKIGYIGGVLLLLRSFFMPNSVVVCALILMGIAMVFGIVQMILDAVRISKNPVDRTAELEFCRRHGVDMSLGDDGST